MANDTSPMTVGPHGESAYVTMNVVSGGTTLSVTGGNTASTAQIFAYLDSTSSGRLGGLGVCSTGASVLGPRNSTSNVCGNASDDNVTTNEFLVLKFDRPVTNLAFWFNSNHDGPDLTNLDLFNLQIGGGPNTPTNFRGNFDCCALPATRAVTLPGVIAANTNIRIAHNNHQFYISGLSFDEVSIPTPAVALLLLLAPLAFGMRRTTS